MKRFASEFDIRALGRTVVKSTRLDSDTKQRKLQLSSHGTERSIAAAYLVLAIGAGFQEPHIPKIPGRELYGGISVHSAGYKNATLLSKQEAKISRHLE
jgi:cation diffusion facilitator CzcD-associated flavoprotein CzcO